MSHILTSSQFFKKCQHKYSNFIYYDDYNGIKNKITVKCLKHGDFTISADGHLYGKKGGCKKCQIENHKKKYNNNGNVFIQKSELKHNQKYDYSKVEYINNETDVIIICPQHGEFKQRPTCHLNRGQGCPECGKKTMGGYGVYNLTNAEKFKKDWIIKSAFLYLVEMNDNNESFIKIGITTQTNVLNRFKGIKYNIKILDYLSGNLYDLVYKEKILLEKYKKYNYIPIKNFKGHLECFESVVLEELKSIFITNEQ